MSCRGGDVDAGLLSFFKKYSSLFVRFCPSFCNNLIRRIVFTRTNERQKVSVVSIDHSRQCSIKNRENKEKEAGNGQLSVVSIGHSRQCSIKTAKIKKKRQGMAHYKNSGKTI